MTQNRSVFAYLFVVALICLLLASASGQDSTGSIRGTISDPSGAMVAGAEVTLTNTGNAREHKTLSTSAGTFALDLLPPGSYDIRVQAPGMAPTVRKSLTVEVGGILELTFRLNLPGATETVEVSGDTPTVQTQPSTVSTVISEQEMNDLPLNGRRFSDLALLAPGVTQDPRGLTSASNGDLAFGGVRGFQTSFLVDGTDNNNGFFAQARGRYRSPYQFSNEVVQEFRVSSNTFGAELGRSGGAVINVVTKSGSNHAHGSAFYYLRDNRFAARHAYTEEKPQDKQHQLGFTLGGPLKKDTAFLFGGFDQHVFRVPAIVHFLNGTDTVIPLVGDYEERDQDLVQSAADRLSRMGGEFRASLLGNAALTKLDWNISPQQYLSVRVNASRYYGQNNVYFDPASPVTTYAMSENGEEDVATETLSASLTSAWSYRTTGHLRAQFSRDLQQSTPNSEDVRTRIDGVIDAFGRSSIMPRETNQRRLQVADTLTIEGARHSWKFGGDVTLTRIRNFFPLMFGGQYIFDNVRVNQWTFEPQTYGLSLTPLRAYAHRVPRYYIQNFGEAVSHPDSNEFSWFAQDTARVTDHLAVTLGLRYDLQTFRSDRLVTNPLWPDSGKVPLDANNFAPRVGFAYSIGNRRPYVVRGGYGVFFTRIPQIYNSAVETENGLNRSHLFLNVSDYWDRLVFPKYPDPLVSCGPKATTCVAPESVAGKLTAEVSTFDSNFRTPVVHQASLGVEHEFAGKVAVGASYLYVHGEHLIRARDANLPPPTDIEYPVFSEDGNEFLGTYYPVDSFAGWQMSHSLECPFAPCVGELQRPVPALGAVNVFETAASSHYHGLTLSARRRMLRGLYFRLAYTWAKAIDDGQDSLVVGRPATVQNSYSPTSERGLSSTDQRHRFMFSWSAQPRPFHRDHPLLRTIFNNWKASGVMTFGTGRPINAKVAGDANEDGNSSNDRLPGVARNSYTGPDYMTTDLRLTRTLNTFGRFRIELSAESFNVLNRVNRRVTISDDGFENAAASFVEQDKAAGGKRYPAHFRVSSKFLTPTNAYAPRQVQFAVRLKF